MCPSSQTDRFCVLGPRLQMVESRLQGYGLTETKWSGNLLDHLAAINLLWIV